MVQYEFIKEKTEIILLWTHECVRVFSDRLVDETDRQWFYKQFNEHLVNHFEFELEIEKWSNFLYGDYVNLDKAYCKIEDFEALPTKFFDYQNIYNSMMPKPLNLVFFGDALKHISRLLRTLR